MAAEGVLAEVLAVKVHLTGSDVPLTTAPAAAGPPKVVASFFTLTLTALHPVQMLIGRADSRDYAIVQALDKAVVLCDSRGQAQSLSNADATLASPEGAVIPVGVVVPVTCANEVWVAASVFPARVSVIAGYRG